MVKQQRSKKCISRMSDEKKNYEQILVLNVKEPENWLYCHCYCNKKLGVKSDCWNKKLIINLKMSKKDDKEDDEDEDIIKIWVE